MSLVFRLAPALFALVPAPALANAGIGYLMLAWPIVLLALVPAVLLEALVIKPLLALPWRRAFALSLSANARSTLWGLAAAVGVDAVLIGAGGSAGPEPTKGAAIAMLVPFLFFSWWIEHRAIVRKLAEAPERRIALATGAANLLSYAGMIAFVVFSGFLPAEGTTIPRARVSEALAAASAMKVPVTERWMAEKKFPAPGDKAFAPVVEKRFRVELASEGQIVVRFTTPEHKALDGKRVELVPVADPSAPGGLAWRCRSPDLEPRLLPAACR